MTQKVRAHRDFLLYYGKSENAVWNGNSMTTPRSEEELRAIYPCKIAGDVFAQQT